MTLDFDEKDAFSRGKLMGASFLFLFKQACPVTKLLGQKTHIYFSTRIKNRHYLPTLYVGYQTFSYFHNITFEIQPFTYLHFTYCYLKSKKSKINTNISIILHLKSNLLLTYTLRCVSNYFLFLLKSFNFTYLQFTLEKTFLTFCKL